MRVLSERLASCHPLNTVYKSIQRRLSGDKKESNEICGGGGRSPLEKVTRGSVTQPGAKICYKIRMLLRSTRHLIHRYSLASYRTGRVCATSSARGIQIQNSVSFRNRRLVFSLGLLRGELSRNRVVRGRFSSNMGKQRDIASFFGGGKAKKDDGQEQVEPDRTNGAEKAASKRQRIESSSSD